MMDFPSSMEGWMKALYVVFVFFYAFFLGALKGALFSFTLLHTLWFMIES